MGDKLLAHFLQERIKQEDENPTMHLANGTQRAPPRTVLEVCGQNRTFCLKRNIGTSLFKLGPSYTCVFQVLQTVGPGVALQPLLKSKSYSLRLSGAALPLLRACKSNDRSATV